eukprot:TRINITY_DN4605_c0_g2_i1.p1 TRINITY_DN4605_c0_g2~~TRINITY_DN4605_c0_g2_i1.p1  ORF type:complete len:420 (+),score=70.04 TRINITY_DN4605_c0_g2_i1:78-1337(+)
MTETVVGDQARPVEEAPAKEAESLNPEEEQIKTCVLTTNVGSAGEDETRELLVKWFSDVRALVDSEGADVLLLHIQEIGGKSFNKSFNDRMEQEARKALCTDNTFWCSGVMSHLKPDDQYTAVAVIIFVNESLKDQVTLFNYQTQQYDNIENLSPVENKHYECQKFADAGKSRKGWVKYCVKIGEIATTGIAVHLYHDDDNWATYHNSEGKGAIAARRSDALAEAMTNLHQSNVGKNLIVGGDMNFRVDGKMLVESVKKRRQTAEVKIEKKRFSWGNDQANIDTLYQEHWRDFEDACCESSVNRKRILQEHQVILEELPVSWAPTYPMNVIPKVLLQAAPDKPAISTPTYSTKRVPAWADRIFYSPTTTMHNIQYKSTPSHLDHALVFLTWDTTISKQKPNGTHKEKESDDSNSDSKEQ